MGYDLMVDNVREQLIRKTGCPRVQKFIQPHFQDVILAGSDFSASRKTIFIIHGFTDNHKMSYVWDAKNLFLENVSVLC